MAETKRELNLLGTKVKVYEVPILTREEPENTYTLEDGSTIKVKHLANTISRIEGQTLPDGRPVYLIFATPVTTVEKWKAK